MARLIALALLVLLLVYLSILVVRGASEVAEKIAPQEGGAMPKPFRTIAYVLMSFLLYTAVLGVL